MKFSWKTYKYNADAETCYNELKSLGKGFTPKQIVDFARNEETELHKCFDWNDETAAEKWRLQQARLVICNLEITATDDTQTLNPVTVNAFSSIDREYKETRLILQNKDEREVLLEQAYGDLQAFKRKYETLEEFAEIIALIK